jgi:hypothetical protein
VVRIGASKLAMATALLYIMLSLAQCKVPDLSQISIPTMGNPIPVQPPTRTMLPMPSVVPSIAAQPSSTLSGSGLRLVTGNWHCHIHASEISDTVVFLHDGEYVVLVTLTPPSGNWLEVQAGTKTCWLNKEAIQ